MKQICKLVVMLLLAFTAGVQAQLVTYPESLNPVSYTHLVVVRTHYSQRTGFVEGHSKRIEIECAHFSGSYVGVGTCFSVTSTYRYAICLLYTSMWFPTVKP